MDDAKPTAIDVFRQLDRSNCGQCGVPSCFGFAALVIKGDKRVQDCPSAPAALRDLFTETLEPVLRRPVVDEAQAAEFEALKREIAALDLADAAQRTGGELRRGPGGEQIDDLDGNRLAIRCLGKLFEIDRRGKLHAMCHVNFWLFWPLLQYALHCEGVPHRGEWVCFADLRGAQDWTRFFAHRCETGLRQLAAVDPDLLFDALSLFGTGGEGKGLSGDDYPDRAIVLHPLPRVRMMVGYWRGDDDFEEHWTILFDRACERNLDVRSIYLLVQGFVEMMRRILERHGGMGPVGPAQVPTIWLTDHSPRR